MEGIGAKSISFIFDNISIFVARIIIIIINIAMMLNARDRVKPIGKESLLKKLILQIIL